MRPALLSLAVATACVGALWFRFNAPPPLRGGIHPHDLLYSYYPKLELLGERLAAGELPLWNPSGCAGVPLLAGIQTAALYPPSWIAAFVPASDAIAWLVLAHLVLAGAGAALLFRRWRAPPLAAGALGGVFVYACAIGQSFWPPQVATIAWLPWLLLCVERCFFEPGSEESPARWRRAAELAAVVALQILAGFPQLLIYSLQLASLLALLRVVQHARHGRAQRSEAEESGFAHAGGALARVSLGVLLGFGIAAAQLVPTAELLAQSERREALSPDEVHYLQREARLAKLLANAVHPAPRVTAFEIGQDAGYLGTATLVLAAVGLAVCRRTALAWGLVAAGAGALLLSDGYHGVARPAYELYASLPLVGSLRSPERLLLVAWLCAIGLAALGAGGLEQASRRERIVATAAALAAALAIAAIGTSRAALLALASAALLTAPMWLPRRPWLQRAAWLAIALLLAGDVLLATGRFGSLRHFPSGWAQVMHVGGRTILGPGDAARQRERVGLGRVEFRAPSMLVRPIAGTGPLRGVARLACYETPVPEVLQKLSRIVHGGDYESLTLANVDPERFPALFDLAGVVEVTRVVARRGTVPGALGPGTVYAEEEMPLPARPPGTFVSLGPNRDALPRAYLVGEHVLAPEESDEKDETLRMVATGTFDYRRSVVLDRDPGWSGAERIASLVPATIERYEPERVEITTDAPGEALLVLSDSDYPGWRATVDGEPAPILRANALFRAVLVPAGQHRVVFEYAPMSFRIGAVISALSLFACAIGAWYGSAFHRWTGRRMRSDLR